MNGGGILIAVNNYLDMKPKVLKFNSKAEILSVTLKLKNNKKICITTCYRVGTLGQSNLSEISKHIQQSNLSEISKHIQQSNLSEISKHIQQSNLSEISKHIQQSNLSEISKHIQQSNLSEISKHIQQSNLSEISKHIQQSNLSEISKHIQQSNLSEISKHIQQIASMKSIISHTFIGDMNLDSVDWTENSSNILLHNDFLSLFDSLNLTQLINSPTHYRGNILDILLSDIPSTISNIVIRGHNEHVKSDH